MQKGESLRTTIICVDSYDGAVPKGRINHLQIGGTQRFHSLTELLIRLVHIFDDTKFPQAFEKIRTFADSEEATKKDEVDETPSRGEKATFVLRILFRQNTSWQGSLYWLEEKEEKSFRSVLELIFLMDSALQPEQKQLSGSLSTR